jgi:hypothetical protein
MAGSGCGFGNTTQDAINKKETESVAKEAQAKKQARGTEVFLKFSSFMNQLLRYAQSYPG